MTDPTPQASPTAAATAGSLQFSKDAIITLNFEGDIVSWNTGAQSIYGYDENEALSLNVLHLMTRERYDEFFECLNVLKKGKSVEARETTRITKDNRHIHVLTEMNPLADEEGSLAGIVLTERDVTHKKAAERESRSAGVAATRVPILKRAIQEYAIFVVDNDGEIMSWNSSARRVTGYEAREAIGQSCTIFYLPEEQTTDKILNELKVASTLGGFESEGWRRKKDGTRFWAHIVIAPIKNNRGEILGFTKSFCDQTRLQMTREALQKSEKHFQALIENTMDILTVLNAEGIIVFQNKSVERFLGYKPEDLVGKSIFDFVHVGDLNEILEGFTRVANGMSFERPIEFRFWHKNHSWHMLEATAINLLDDPNVSGIIVSARDITERKRFDEAVLQASEDEQTRVAQELHDGLNQELGAIELKMRLLADKLKAKKHPESNAAADIIRHIKAAMTSTRNLSHGLYPVGLKSHGLIASLETLAEDMMRLYGVACQLETDIARIQTANDAVATHVYHIVRESARNAIRHGKADTVLISAVRMPTRVVVTVRDNGHGFDPNSQEGRGIGLRIMQHRAKMIDASLDIQRNEDMGMTVVCSFPATSDSK